MKIALTSQNRKNITGHAGMCRNFLIYEIEDGQVRSRALVELSKEQTFHSMSGPQAHPLDGINLLISGGMGAGLKRNLASRGIETIVTAEIDPELAVTAYLSGTLVPDTGHVCDCSENEHQHQHPHHAHGGCSCG